MTEFYAIADMEGITGISSYEREMYPHCPEYPRARQNLIADMRAALDGARSAGATHFTIYDVHYHADNLVGADLGPNVTLYPGKPKANGLRQEQQGLFIIGLHAMAGVRNGVLPHTYNHPIEEMTLNGQPLGEIGLEAYGAGALGIPLCLVTADEAGCREAEALAPGVITVATKRLREDGEVELYDEGETRERIFQAAAEAVRKAPFLAPLPDPGESRLMVRYNSPEFTEQMREKSGAERLGDRTLLFTGVGVYDAYEQFRLTQIRSG
ncbi:MAG: M55 family metallopeptidase [Armatimonadetes bacterium]|nr:M55 family metallopeptidase [Armatimonadota bacterium]